MANSKMSLDTLLRRGAKALLSGDKKEWDELGEDLRKNAHEDLAEKDRLAKAAEGKTQVIETTAETE